MRGKSSWRRRGAIVVMTAVGLTVMAGMSALCVDLAVVAVSRSQLTTASEAAALAGAARLVSENRVRGATSLTTETTAARSTAISFAAANPTLGTPTVVLDATKASVGDITIGYLDPTAPTATLDASASATLWNSVRVVASRDEAHGGLVPNFFGQIWGLDGSTVRVASTATASNWSISGFKSENGAGANLLPIALDVYTFDEMMAGRTTDQYTYNPATGAVTAGADGVAESQLYPVKNGSPGNWGTVKLGVSNNSTSTLGSQIRNGITPAQLATFPDGTIQLSTATSPPSIDLEGNPGISAGIKDDLTSIIGKPVALPVFSQLTGNGNNAVYRIVKFPVVRIMSVNFQGSPKHVIIQPALMKDPTAIAGSLQSSWSDGGLVMIRLTR